ncbi:MAG TPA: UvrD-helicase domain-containing protein [Candidatus Megaira endosymbiont of Hartmannula sinica]|nr:UvrD-helicase domain-containing protein [Candidatus Megaera endosymbiont of Hartmannula sinica]
MNNKQIEAVNHIHGPLLVLAGAGTGKTTVITNRIANIIHKNYAGPSDILAVTFTNKAGNEMKQRMYNLIGNESKILNIGTFHSISLMILRRHIYKIGNNLNNGFTVISEDDQTKLIKQIIKEQSTEKPTNEMISKISCHISSWKDCGLMPEEITTSINNLSKQEQDSLKIYKIYQLTLVNSNVIDFDDFLLYCNKLFIKNKELLNYYQNKFKYILVDEYQDTNTSQHLWLRMLANKHLNLCCVGDDDQSIYSWRGAKIRNILKFSYDFPGAKIITLEQNYRSGSHILNIASDVISENNERHPKKLWTENQKNNLVQITSFTNGLAEAKNIAATINQIINKHNIKAKNIAILFRSTLQTMLFEEALTSYNINYNITGGLKFYARKEIRDIICYIRLIINPHDNIAFERIINTPKRGVGNGSLQKIKEYSKLHFHNIYNNKDEEIDQIQPLSLYKTIRKIIEDNNSIPNLTITKKSFSSKIINSFQEFIEIIEHTKQELENNDAATVISNLIKKTKYIDHLKDLYEDESVKRIDHINQLLAAISRFDDVRDFLHHASLVMDNETAENNTTNNNQIKEEEEFVNLMTIHSAKGLEFDVVFIPGFEEGIFPHHKGLKYNNTNHENNYDNINNKKYINQEISEERRLAYVALTRAKNFLYISYASNRLSFVEGRKIFENTEPSIFLHSINKKDYNFTKAINSFTNIYNYSNGTNQKQYHHDIKNNSQIITANDSSQIFKIGNNVEHVKFGQGIIIKMNNDIAQVAFKNQAIKSIKVNFLNKIK